jgi:hypothetical protein
MGATPASAKKLVSGEARVYAHDQAPMKRMRFCVGNKVKTQADREFIVKEVTERHGLLIYVGENQQLPKPRSGPLQSAGTQERLFGGRGLSLNCATVRWRGSPARAHLKMAAEYNGCMRRRRLASKA